MNHKELRYSGNNSDYTHIVTWDATLSSELLFIAEQLFLANVFQFITFCFFSFLKETKIKLAGLAILGSTIQDKEKG